jgi:hypothetical protein
LRTREVSLIKVATPRGRITIRKRLSGSFDPTVEKVVFFKKAGIPGILVVRPETISKEIKETPTPERKSRVLSGFREFPKRELENPKRKAPRMKKEDTPG